jgi:uncharacterized protein
MVRDRLSAAQARRVALTAQGFADGSRDRPADGWALRRVLGRIGLLQIDSVNVLARAHYLPLFSRVGPYDTAMLDRAAWNAPRRLFEYWGHEASLLPVTMHPLLRWRMEAGAAQDAWHGVRRVAQEHPDLVDRVWETVAERGPISASELAADHGDGDRRSRSWGDWSNAKLALESLFWSGRVTAARRRGFERLYELPERVLPREVIAAPTPDAADAQRELVRIASRALGVATERDLRAYFRLSAADARARVAELVDAGELAPVAVEGWGAAYLDPAARIPRRVDARALIGPFDSLIWERPRVQRLFGLRYRIELYVPAPKRVHGYYVLPFLLGDTLVARVDLKADRKAGELLVQAAHAEPDAPHETAEALLGELELMASWLGLGRVRVVGRGDLVPALRAAGGARAD